MKRLLLLAIALALAAPAHSAVIKLGKGCNMYQAIQAANMDRRVGRCRPGKGADEIQVGGRFSNPLKPYPTITSVITIKNPRQFSATAVLGRDTPASPPVLFKVGLVGTLTFEGNISIVNRALKLKAT